MKKYYYAQKTKNQSLKIKTNVVFFLISPKIVAVFSSSCYIDLQTRTNATHDRTKSLEFDIGKLADGICKKS